MQRRMTDTSVLDFVCSMQCVTSTQIHKLFALPKFDLTLRRTQQVLGAMRANRLLNSTDLPGHRSLLFLGPKALKVPAIAERCTRHATRAPNLDVAARAWLRAEYRYRLQSFGWNVGNSYEHYVGFIKRLLRRSTRAKALLPRFATLKATECLKCGHQPPGTVKRCDKCNGSLKLRISKQRFGCTRCSFVAGTSRSHKVPRTSQACTGRMLRRDYTRYDIALPPKGAGHVVVYDDARRSVQAQLADLPIVATQQPAVAYRFVETRSIYPLTLDGAIETSSNRSGSFDSLARRTPGGVLTKKRKKEYLCHK